MIRIAAICLIGCLICALCDWRIARNAKLPRDDRTWSDE